MLSKNLYVRNDFVNGERCLIFYFLYSTIEMNRHRLTFTKKLQAVIRKNEYVLNYDKQIDEFIAGKYKSKFGKSVSQEQLSNRAKIVKELGIKDDELTEVWKELDVEPIIDEIKQQLLSELNLQTGIAYKDVTQGMKVLDQVALGCFEVSDANNFEQLASPVVIDGKSYTHIVKMQLEDVSPNFEFRLDINEDGKAIQQNN